MITTKDLENRIHHYSNAEFKLWQIEMNVLYNNAIDVLPYKYTYEETNEPINEELLD